MGFGHPTTITKALDTNLCSFLTTITGKKVTLKNKRLNSNGKRRFSFKKTRLPFGYQRE